MHPVLFTLGNLPVRSYGTLLVIGFLLGLWRIMRVAAHRFATEPADSPRRINPDNVFDVGMIGLFCGIAGARLLYVLLDWPSYAGHPLDALKIWQGGLSLHGGMLFGTLWLFYYCWRKKISILAMADLGATCFAIAYAFGRIGCLLNGCCYGGVCEEPWAMRFPDEAHPGLLTPPSHPTQLYGTLFNLGFFLILRQWEKRSRADGEVFYGYLALYGAYRYFIESFRAGVTSTYLIPSLHLTDTHIISLIMMIGGVFAIAWLRRVRPIYRNTDLTPPRPAVVGSETFSGS